MSDGNVLASHVPVSPSRLLHPQHLPSFQLQLLSETCSSLQLWDLDKIVLAYPLAEEGFSRYLGTKEVWGMLESQDISVCEETQVEIQVQSFPKNSAFLFKIINHSYDYRFQRLSSSR